MAIEILHSQPGSAYDDATWQAIHALFETSFPGLPAGIARAESVGVRWRDVTTPFFMLDDGVVVAHVGVLDHTLRIDGTDTRFAGVHAVCTHPDHRRRGYARELLARVCAWVDTWTTHAKLATDDPPVYSGHGFEPVATHRFRSSLAPARNVEARLLQPSRNSTDRVLLQRLLADRAPASKRVCSIEPGWLFLIDCALYNLLDTGLHYLPEYDAIVATSSRKDGHRVLDVVAEDLPPAEAVLSVIPEDGKPAWWTFSPDHFDPAALPEPTPESHGWFMVRGGWPHESGPMGLSPLWEH